MTKDQRECEISGHNFVTGLIHTYCIWCGFVRVPDKCKRHPHYKAIRRPQVCSTCWAIYNRKHDGRNK